MRVTVALALHKVDGHQQIQLRERLVEFGAVGSRDNGVAAVDQHRLDLAAPRSRYLLGQFAERMRTCDHVPARQPALVRLHLGHIGQPQRVDITGLIPASARTVHPAGDHVEHVSEPLRDGACEMQGHSGARHHHRAACGGEVAGHLFDLCSGDIASRRQIVKVGVGDERA